MDIMIDPPSGWMFGFPKRLSSEEYESEDFRCDDWLVANGYPQEMIEELGDMFYVRCWEVH